MTTHRKDKALPPSTLFKSQQAIALLPKEGSRITLLMRRFFNVLLQYAQQAGSEEIYRASLEKTLFDAKFNSHNIEVAKDALRSIIPLPTSLLEAHALHAGGHALKPYP